MAKFIFRMFVNLGEIEIETEDDDGYWEAYDKAKREAHSLRNNPRNGSIDVEEIRRVEDE